MPRKFFSLGRACAVVLACASVLPLPALAVKDPEPTWDKFDEALDITPQVVVDAMLKLANVGPRDLVMDLGCGEGRILVTAAKRYGARGLGVDINPDLITRANANAQRNNVVDKVTFVEGDLYEADLSSATVITLFLWPSMNVRLRPRLLDLVPGTRIVSHEHEMGDWRPDKTTWVSTRTRRWGDREILLWIVPAKINGNWQLSGNGRAAFDMRIEQKHQRFFGSAIVDGRSQAILNGRINGAEVSFDLGVTSGQSRRYTGRVTPIGEIDGNGWRAKRKE